MPVWQPLPRIFAEISSKKGLKAIHALISKDSEKSLVCR